MKKFKVGVIGNGFVGEAISFAFSSVSDMYVYDTDPLKSLDDLESVHSCDFVFICVPTPMFQDGSQDLSYVESTFEKATIKPVYILKSTVLPGTTEELSKKYSNIIKPIKSRFSSICFPNTDKNTINKYKRHIFDYIFNLYILCLLQKKKQVLLSRLLQKK